MPQVSNYPEYIHKGEIDALRAIHEAEKKELAELQEYFRKVKHQQKYTRVPLPFLCPLIPSMLPLAYTP